MSAKGKQRLEPWDELPDKNLRKVQAMTDAAFNATNTMEINLQEDSLKVPGQNWACVSFVSPDGNQKNKNFGLKIRGVFDTQAEANEHVKRLIRLDPLFDIYVCQMYNWCLAPPDPTMIGDQNYQDEELNKIVGEYRKNQIYAKEHFEERKREMMEQAAEEAKQAALRKLEESEAESELVTEVPEVTEVIGEDSSHVTSGTVSASEIMESMMNSNLKI